MKLKYKSLQTIKHALQHYIQREGITEDDFKSEASLIEKVVDEINTTKDRYNIS